MTYKWIGAAMIIAGCGGFGLRLAAAACLEERRLSQIMQLLRRMQSQLQYQLTPLPELCSQCGRDVGGPVGRVLQSLGKELESRMYPDVYSCMRAALQADQELSPACRRLLVQLGRELGRFDLTGQLQGLQAVSAACREQRQRLRQDQQVRLRSYRTLSLCAGAALAILLV